MSSSQPRTSQVDATPSASIPTTPEPEPQGGSPTNPASALATVERRLASLTLTALALCGLVIAVVEGAYWQGWLTGPGGPHVLRAKLHALVAALFVLIVAAPPVLHRRRRTWAHQAPHLFLLHYTDSAHEQQSGRLVGRRHR